MKDDFPLEVGGNVYLRLINGHPKGLTYKEFIYKCSHPPSRMSSNKLEFYNPSSCWSRVMCLKYFVLKSDIFRLNLRRKSEKFSKSEGQLLRFDFITTVHY
jgi:hypothetical protein